MCIYYTHHVFIGSRLAGIERLQDASLALGADYHGVNGKPGSNADVNRSLHSYRLFGVYTLVSIFMKTLYLFLQIV